MQDFDRYTFRGKRFDNGEWVYGHYLPCSKYPELSEIKSLTERNGYGDAEYFRVDPKTVGQCTGLKDKNGKLIFEGDIIKVVDSGISFFKEGEFVEVEWIDEGGFYPFCWNAQEQCDPISPKNCEIIGNFYENPEIIKEQDKSQEEFNNRGDVFTKYIRVDYTHEEKIRIVENGYKLPKDLEGLPIGFVIEIYSEAIVDKAVWKEIDGSECDILHDIRPDGFHYKRIRLPELELCPLNSK